MVAVRGWCMRGVMEGEGMEESEGQVIRLPLQVSRRLLFLLLRTHLKRRSAVYRYEREVCNRQGGRCLPPQSSRYRPLLRPLPVFSSLSFPRQCSFKKVVSVGANNSRR